MTQRGMGLFAAILLASVAPARAADAPDDRRWWSHVEALADDALEGRETGSRGHKVAAEYVAGQFGRIGLKPAGTDGYLRPIKLQSRRIVEAHSALALDGPGGAHPLILGDDAILSLRADPAPTVEAEMVFVGHGLTISEAGIDDFREVDVRGKVAVYLGGVPPTLTGPLAAFVQAPAERAEMLRQAGAIGFVSIQNPRTPDFSWSRQSKNRGGPSLDLADPALDEARGLKLAFYLNPERADRLLEGSGHAFREVLDLAGAGAPLPHFAIPSKVRATVAVERADLESQNVLAILPGTDPALKTEAIVCTAHLDHLGIGDPIGGDAIYNGAMDNASGVAALLDAAAILAESGARPRRSILFAAVTGEEIGRLGSRALVHAPPADAPRPVANVNIDMFLPLYPLKRLTVYGLDDSNLGLDAHAVADPLGITSQADPEPKYNRFIRGDQYSFIRRGIPSIALKIGFVPGSPEEQTARKWLLERYHDPSDDLHQPVDKRAAAEFDALLAKLLLRICERDRRPRWKESSFYRRFEE